MWRRVRRWWGKGAAPDRWTAVSVSAICYATFFDRQWTDSNSVTTPLMPFPIEWCTDYTWYSLTEAAAPYRFRSVIIITLKVPQDKTLTSRVVM